MQKYLCTQCEKPKLTSIHVAHSAHGYHAVNGKFLWHFTYLQT